MANNLTKFRGKHGLTQAELAEKVGFTKQALSLNETGKCSPRVARAVAEILHENAFEIIGTDALLMLPETEAEKAALIKIIKEL